MRRFLFSLAIALSLILLAVFLWPALRKPTRGALQVETTISDSSGEKRAASSATLYLLDTDMLKLALAKEGQESELQRQVFTTHPKLRNLAGVLNARRREAYSLGPDVALFMEQSEQLWQPHVLQTTHADRQGRAVFNNLEPGQYWLMCRAETADKGTAFWNLPLTINRGENQVRLEPFNSLQCSSCK